MGRGSHFRCLISWRLVTGWHSAARPLPVGRMPVQTSRTEFLCAGFSGSGCLRLLVAGGSLGGCDGCLSLNVVPLFEARWPVLFWCRIDIGVAVRCWVLLSVTFWIFSCRQIVRVLRSAPPDVPVRPPEAAPPTINCSPSISNTPPRAMTLARGSETTLAVPAADRLRRLLPPPRKARVAAAPSSASRA